LSHRAIRCDQRNDSRSAIDVRTAAPVDNDFVPPLIGNHAQVGMRHERAVRSPSYDATLPSSDDQKLAIRQPVDAKGQAKGSPQDDLAAAIYLGGENLLSAPV